MPQYTRVQPGDVITAAAFNQILDALEQLDGRVDTLEGTTPGGGGDTLAITGLQPPSGPYRVGDSLTVLGRSFQYSLGAARVFLDGVRVLNLSPSSSDTQLVFLIPPVPGVVEAGTTVTLRVNNQTEEVTRQVVLQPALQQLFGDVDVEWLAVDPATPQPDQALTFQFRITSRASATADFTIQPQITVAANQQTWNQRLRVLDAGLSEIPSRLVRLDPLQARLILVRITQVPSGTAGTDFTLTTTATSGGVTGSSGQLPFQVGQATETPDTSISLVPTSSVPPTALVGNAVTATAGQTVRVVFNAQFQQTGDYDVTVSTPGSTSGWTVGRFLTTPATYQIQAGDIGAGGVAVRTPEITIQPAGGASSSGQAELRLQRQGAATSRAFTLDLNLGT